MSYIENSQASSKDKWEFSIKKKAHSLAFFPTLSPTLQDYEHCKSLYTKFNDLNALVEATGPARYGKSEALAQEIIEGNPNMKVRQV